jgi:hypothetical protein
MRWLSVMRLARLVRSNVDRQLCPNGRSGESGAVAAIVGVMFAFGVVLGLGAIVIDTGSLLFERRQLQNGADAAALSIAQTCADADQVSALCAAPDITNTPTSSALVTLAGANAADKRSDITSVCASLALHNANPIAFPTVCPTPASPGLVQCPPTSSTAKYVEVSTATRSADGTSTIMPPILGQMLYKSTYSGETVQACARAGWGSLGSADNSLPLLLGACGWNEATNFGKIFAPAPNPQYSPAPNQTPTRAVPPVVPLSTIVAITAHTSSGINGVYKCNATGPAGQLYPGGFGWSATTGGTCSANFLDSGTVAGNPGGAPPSGCKGTAISDFVGTVVYIPIFTSVVSGTYPVDGLAAFYLAGYSNIPTAKDVDGYTKPAGINCADIDPITGKKINNSTCIWGWFTAPLATVGSLSDPGVTPRGPLVVQVLG